MKNSIETLDQKAMQNTFGGRLYPWNNSYGFEDFNLSLIKMK